MPLTDPIGEPLIEKQESLIPGLAPTKPPLLPGIQTSKPLLYQAPAESSESEQLNLNLIEPASEPASEFSLTETDAFIINKPSDLNSISSANTSLLITNSTLRDTTNSEVDPLIGKLDSDLGDPLINPNQIASNNVSDDSNKSATDIPLNSSISNSELNKTTAATTAVSDELVENKTQLSPTASTKSEKDSDKTLPVATASTASEKDSEKTPLPATAETTSKPEEHQTPLSSGTTLFFESSPNKISPATASTSDKSEPDPTSPATVLTTDKSESNKTSPATTSTPDKSESNKTSPATASAAENPEPDRTLPATASTPDKSEPDQTSPATVLTTDKSESNKTSPATTSTPDKSEPDPTSPATASAAENPELDRTLPATASTPDKSESNKTSPTEISTTNNLETATNLEPNKTSTPEPDRTSTPPTNINFDSNAFTVDEKGIIGIQFTSDGGWYSGQLAIVSLLGMEKFVPGSEAFIFEAASRALSNSTKGYIAINDDLESAYYTDPNSSENLNSGQYLGTKTFAMTPGDKFFFMLVPNGTVQQVYDNPAIGGDKKPLFSIATDNPSDGFSIGQIADITGEGKLFVMEDMGLIQGSDRDYDDITFRVTGATSKIVPLSQLVDPLSASIHSQLVQKLKGESDKSEPKFTAESTVTNSGDKSQGETPSITADNDQQKPQPTATSTVANSDSPEAQPTETSTVDKSDTQESQQIETSIVGKSDTQESLPTETSTVGKSDTQESLPTATSIAVKSDTQESQPTETSTVGKSDTEEAQPTATSTFGKSDTQESPPTATSTVGKSDTQESLPTATSTVGKSDTQESQQIETSTVGKSDTQESPPTATSTVGKSDTQESPPTATSTVDKSDSQESPATETSIVGQSDTEEAQPTATSTVGKSDTQESQQIEQTASPPETPSVIPNELNSESELPVSAEFIVSQSADTESIKTDTTATNRIPQLPASADYAVNNAASPPTAETLLIPTPIASQPPAKTSEIADNLGEELPRETDDNLPNAASQLPVQITEVIPASKAVDTQENDRDVTETAAEFETEQFPTTTAEIIATETEKVADLIEDDTAFPEITAEFETKQLVTKTESIVYTPEADDTVERELPVAEITAEVESQQLPSKTDDFAFAEFAADTIDTDIAVTFTAELETENSPATVVNSLEPDPLISPSNSSVQTDSPIPALFSTPSETAAGTAQIASVETSISPSTLKSPPEPNSNTYNSNSTQTETAAAQPAYSDTEIAPQGADITSGLLPLEAEEPAQFSDGIADSQPNSTQRTGDFQSNTNPPTNLSITTTANLPPIPGTFLVDNQGQVRFDYVFDGGSFEGELGIFSLAGMSGLTPGTPEFITEALRRVLSNSTEGHVVISDATEGAKFTGAMPFDGSRNSGEYQGIKTFNMTPGDTFAVMLVPDDTVQSSLDSFYSENVYSGSRPLFSIANANPNDTSYVLPLADTTGTGNTFAMEDMSAANSDSDYNDLIFTVLGATGNAPLLDSVIDPDREWRNTALGQQLIEYANSLVEPTEPNPDTIWLVEGTTFANTYSQTLTIPASPSTLDIGIVGLNFDTSDTNPKSINDAFEISLVDGTGKSLIGTIASGKNASFNITEGLPPQLAPGVTFNGGKISIDLSQIAPGTAATLQVRLVNNDGDAATKVGIASINVQAGAAPPPTPTTPSGTIPDNTPIDFAALRDVSGGVETEYGQTSFNSTTKVLHADLALKNIGQYPLRDRLLVGVTNISDPTVRLLDASGITPDGIVYYDATSLSRDGLLKPGETTLPGTLKFYNPSSVLFSYDLVFLSELNRPPEFSGTLDTEVVIGKPYVYTAAAVDPDGDAITYSLLEKPNGMEIDSVTGRIAWPTVAGDIGNHAVTVQADDGNGGITTLTYTLSALSQPPNRPPIFTSTPVVDAWINTPYRYDSDATDPDSDTIGYKLILGPEGMKVNPNTGLVEWTPPAVLVLGDTVLGKISLPGERDEFTFSGTAGQRIYIDPLQYSGAAGNWKFDIQSPSGETVSTNLDSNKILNLTETGNYRIVTSTNGDATGSYGFSVIDLGLVPAVPFDTTIKGTLSPGSEDDLFRFTGSKGQKLFFDNKTNSGGFNWILYSADSKEAKYRGSEADMELYLPKDGEYVLAIRGNSSFTSTVDYSFEIVTPDDITVPIVPGSNAEPNSVYGELKEKGETDYYTFTGEVGQRIYFDRLFYKQDIPNGYWPHTAKLIGPSGAALPIYNLEYNYDGNPITLKESGTYRIEIDGTEENTGTYSFSVLDLGLAALLNLDTDISGTLNPGQETHLYQFTGSKSQRLFFDTPGGTVNTNWTLYDSGNNVVPGGDASQNTDMEVVLPNSGTYTLAIRGYNNNTPVNYSFKVITPDVQAGTLAFNVPVSSSIGEKGEQDVYTFTGTKGQRVFLDTLMETPNNRATLVSPSGTKVINNSPMESDSYWRSPVILPENGTYSLTVDGDNQTTDPYSFRLVDASNVPVLQKDATSPTSGTLNPGRAIQFYQFTGAKGDRVYFDSQENSGTAAWSLYNSNNGVLVNNVNLSTDFEYPLEGDGTYYLMLRGENSTPVNYQIQLITTTSPPAPMTLSAPVTSSISKLGEQDAYTFTGNVGQTLYFDPRIGNSDITVKIYSPSGKEVLNGNTGTDRPPFTLTEAGTYKVTVDGLYGKTGDYSFILSDAAPLLPLGTPLSGSLAAKETVLYKINGTAGQQLTFAGSSASSGAEWVLYAPQNLLNPESYYYENNRVGSANLNTGFTSTLPADGTYILALRNPSANSVSYSNIQANSTLPPATTNSGLGMPYGGTLSAPGEVDENSFTAKAGTLIYFDGQSNAPGRWVRLLKPNSTNDFVFNNLDSQSDGGAYQLTQTGPYKLEVYGYPATTTGNYSFQLVDLKASPTLALNAPINVSLNPRETKAYKFTGTVGQKVWLDGLNTSGTNVTAKLLNSSGLQVAYTGDLSNDIELQTLEADGEYYLVLQSNNTSQTTANFRLLDNTDTGATTLTSLDNTTVSGNFGTSKRETVLYKFQGSENQTLYFDRLDGDFYNYYRLYSPNGQQLFYQYGVSDYEQKLPSSGEYVLAFDGDNQTNNNYGVRLVTPTDGAFSLTIGNTVNGEISKAGQQNTYTFAGTEGQRLWFDSLLAAGNINGTLYSPTNAIIWNSQNLGSDLEPAALTTLKETGNYRFVVDGSGDATGSYSFRLLDLAAAAQTTFLDTNTTGNFGTSKRDAVVYKFTGTGGQYVYFDRIEGGGSNYSVYSPDGQRFFYQDLSYDPPYPYSYDYGVEPTKLPSSGEYTLVFNGTGQTNNNYNLRMVTPDLVTQPHTIGNTIMGAIGEPGEQDTYTFTGTPGQQLWLDSLFPSSNITAYLYSPTGKLLLNGHNLGDDRNSSDLLTLTEAGTYTLKVDGSYDYTGAYQFRFLDSAAATVTSLDTPIAGNFGTFKREAIAYRFNGTQGQPLYFDSTVGDAANNYFLYDPYGKQIFDYAGLSSDNEKTALPFSGEYTLILSGKNATNNNYNLRIVTPDIVTTPYTVGDTVSGTIGEAGEQDIYAFRGTIGQKLWFDSLENSSTFLTVKLVDPDGVTVFGEWYNGQYASYDREPVILTKEGNYKLIVDGSADSAGNTYSFRLLDLAEGETLTLDAPISGNFGTSKREAKTYKFQGAAGSSFYFDMTAGDPYNYYYLYDPYGKRLTSGGLTNDPEQPLSVTGEYSLVLSGQDRPNNNYEFKVVRPELTTVPLTLGQTVSQSIDKAGEKDTYTFDGKVGQKLFFDGLTGNSNLSAQLYDPFGNAVVGTSGYSSVNTSADWQPPTLNASGTYRLVVDATNNNTGNYSFKLSDLADSSPLNLTAPNIGTAEIGEVDLYKITGRQGQVLNFDLSAAAWSNGGNWVLYGPDNKAIVSPPWNSPDFKVALPTAGLYTLAITGNNSSPVSYNFSATDNTPAPQTSAGLNSIISGTLTAGGVTNHTFTASAGTQIFLDSINNNNWQIRARLIAPDGSRVFDNEDTSLNTLPKVLPQTGEYTLQIYGYYTSSTGSYQLRVAELPNSLRSPITNYLEIGSPVSGTLSGAEAKVYTFDGVEGLRVAFNGMVGTNVSATLYDPTGKAVFTKPNFQYTDVEPLTLTQNGLYQLVIEGQQATNQNYSFQLLELSGASFMPFNLPVTGTLASGQQSKFYKFEGNKGDRLFFDSIVGNYSNYWKLIGPDNKQVTYNWLGSDLPVELPATGEYALLIEGGTSSAPVNYQFRALRYEKTAADIVTPGTGETGSNSLGSSGLYPVKLEASDGQGGKDLQEYSIRVWPDPTNSNPVIVSDPVVRFGLDDKIYRYQLAAVDPDGDRLKYRLVDGPLGALINGDSGELLWFPENIAAGSKADFTVEVADPRGGKGLQKFTVDAYGALGKIQGAVFDDLNGNGFRDSKLVKGNNPAIIVAIDVSGSTAAPFAGPAGVDDVLKAQVAATLTLIDTLIAQGLGDRVNIGLIPHQYTAQIQDMDPATPGVQPYTTPLADKNNNGIPDIREILASDTYTIPNGHNDFTRAVEAIDQLVPYMPGDKNIIFMSDGYGALDATVSATVRADLTTKGIGLTAFGIGQYSTLDTIKKLDPEAVILSDIDQLSSVFGGFDPRYTIEPLMENVPVYLDLNNNGVLDPDEPKQLTKKDDSESILGQTNYQFTFDNLVPGTYKVRAVAPSDYIQTAPSSSVFTDTVTAAGQTFTHLFGVHKDSQEPVNSDPTFLTVAPPFGLKAGEPLVYRALASDPDADEVTYSLVLNPPGMSVDPKNGTVVWTPTAAQVEEYYKELRATRDRLIAFGRPEAAPSTVKFNVVLRATDGKGGQALQYVEVELIPPNNPPLFASIPPSDLQPQIGKRFEYRAVAADADGDIITYALLPNAPAGITVNPTTGLVTWTPTAGQLGTNSFTVKATDGKGGESKLEVPLRVIEAIPNRPPDITSDPRTSARTGSGYFYKLAVTDPDGNPISFTLVSKPAGMTVDSEGLVAWTPTAAQTGPQTVSVSVSDGQGGTDTQSWTVNVSNSTANRLPSITSVPDTVTNLEKVYRYQLTGTDPDGDYLLWSLDSAPNGMVIDTKTGGLSWQPTSEQIGEHTVAVRVTDSLGSYTGQEFSLKVTGINTPPAIVSIPVTIAGVNGTYKYQVFGTDPENDTLRYSLGTKPDGMKIDARTGLIEWTPGANFVGSHTVEVLATDTQGGVGNQKFAVSVGTAAINLPPTVVSTPVFAASLGSQYSYPVQATDPESGSLTYQLLKAPMGMAINAATGLLTWDNPTAGNHQIVVGAADAGGLGAAQGFTLTARANSTPIVPAVPVVQSAVVGSTYRYDLRATDAEGDLLAYSLIQSPSGMTVDEFGRISWMPQATDVGTTGPVQVAITDTFGKTVSVSYNLSVVADTSAPKVNIVASKNTANLGDSVTFTVNAVDNVKVESLGLTINGTPVVLDAQGQASVKVNNLGNFTAIATAKDSAGNAGTATQTVAAIDPTDVNAPVINIALEDDAEITAPFNITGTISDSNLAYYTLEVAPVGGGQIPGDGGGFKEVYRGTAAVSNGTVATFDPTVLANGAYVLKFTAIDTNGNGSTTERTVNVAGDLKLGNFRLSFTDLTVPVAGIPINVTRTYDSLNANNSDDFGYGWRMEFRDTDLKTSLKADPTYEELGINTVAFDSKTKVFITLPGGKRETFTFKPTPHHLNQYLGAAGPGAAMYKPAFESQKGSTVTLTVKDANLIRNEYGEYYGVNGQPFNPENPAFGGVYVLTTQEGLVYEIDAKTGDLLTATDANGNKLSFSDAGIASSTGKSVTFERDAAGRIVGVVDPDGKKVKYEYDAKGDLVAVKDRENNTTTFKYEDEDRPHFLTEVIDSLGRSGVKTEYDEKGRLKQMIDANGSAVELVYDPNNSIQKVKDVFGKETTYVYDSRGNVLTEIDPLGKRVDRTFDGDNNVLTETVITTELNAAGNSVEVKSKTEWTYDAKGNKLTEKDALGNVTRWTYNSRGQVLTETDALGNAATYTYSPSGNLLTAKDAKGNVSKFSYDMRGNLLTLTDTANKVTNFTYDGSGNVLSLKDALGNTTTYTYDSSGNRLTETRTVTTPSGVQTLVTKSTYDSNGKVKSTTDGLNGVTKYEYDANGNQVAVIDALNRRTDYRYDSKGQLVETIYPDNTLSYPADNPRTINIYDKGGRLRATVDRDNSVTHYNYDDAGRLVETIYQDKIDTLAQLIQAVAPNQTPATIDWTQVIYPDIAPVFLSNNPRSKTEYYKNGDVKAEIDERGNRTEYRYNINGQLEEVIYADATPDNSDNPRSRTEYDKLGRTVASIDALGRVTRYEYDSLGRLVKTVYPDSSPNNLLDNPTNRTEYDSLGRRISATDAAGKTVKYEYDALGRLTAVVQTLNQAGTNPINLRTEYGYDEAGRLIWQEDAEDNRTEFEYDKNGRRVVVELPLNQRSSTIYDAAGNVQSVTDFNGNTITYGYDAENRLTNKQFSVSGESPVTFTYTSGGQIKTVVKGQETTTFNYDELGRLVSRIDPDGPYLASGATIEYGYDAAGNRTSVRTPAGLTQYEYDEQNRLEKVIDPDLAQTKYFYDAEGNLERTQLPNGVVESRTYDELNRLKLLTYQRNGATLQSFDYSLDPVGHRRVVTEQNGRKVEYEYDDLYRLRSETIFAPGGTVERTVSYGYDAVGNRLSKTDSVGGVTTYSYDDNDRLLKEELRPNGVLVKTTEYRYDANGNTTRKIENGTQETVYTWNQENRLIGVQTPTGENISYAYDADGVRVSKTVNGVTTEYLVDKNLPYAQVLEESVNDALIASYVYGLDLISQERGVNDSYYLVDGLGSTRGLTNASGVVTDTYSYDAFGNLIASAGNVENDYLFAGEQLDEDLGQYYLRERYYNQSVGRFTRRDTYEGSFEDPMSLHKYLYAHANPVTYTDPTGLFSAGEAQAAADIANTLAGIQWESGSHLIGATINKGDYSTADLVISMAIGFGLVTGPVALSFLRKGVGAKKLSFPNTLPDNLPQELALARRLNVKPLKAGNPAFDRMIDTGEKVKWAVTETGELFFIPAIVNGREIAHSVINNGEPVLAAGEAMIAGSRNQYFVLEITNHSGHYLPNGISLDIGRAAFELNGLHLSPRTIIDRI
ncbi:Rhs family protein (plasmid) [Oscillatoria nigro-viridis PCC 7112]|uniref:Rhs family protein n=1 Tax=Phormidium nigroviride PCC 7112 TaxID=179408 RepID=K9VTD3_9CYAN|nr:putative Ig domain-containing protein [Oscillatoria nigro-viridis]AFZ10490.1 Rhs family protein [Oscillatoria nigro-viridis PCC 7112]